MRSDARSAEGEGDRCRRPRWWAIRAAVAVGVICGGAALGSPVADAAAKPGVTVVGKTLSVTGSNASDLIALRVDPARSDVFDVDVGDNETADFTIERSAFSRIEVDAGRGDDHVRVDDANGAFTDTTPTHINGEAGNDELIGGAGDEHLDGGAGSDTVEGGPGDDDVDLGGGGDSFVWQPGHGDDRIRGGGGNDSLTVVGSDDDEAFRLAPRGARARLTRDIDAVALTLQDIEQVDVHSVNGNDTLAVGDLTGTGIRTVTHDEANSPDGTSPDVGNDQTILRGTQGDDKIVAKGAGTEATVTGLAATVKVVGGDGIRDALEVRTLGGKDTVRASNFDSSASTLTVDAGSGDDALIGSPGPDVLKGGGGADTIKGNDGTDTIEGDAGPDALQGGAGDDHFTWKAGDGSDTAEGQAGTDTLTFTGDDTAERFAVEPNGHRISLTRSVGHTTQDLNRIETVSIAARGGADHVRVGDLTGTDLTYLQTDLAATPGDRKPDDQPDTVTANETDGADSVSLSGSAGSATVFSATAFTQLNIAGANPAQDRLTINGHAGADTILADNLQADAVGLQINGGDGDDIMFGGGGDDIIFGGQNNDFLEGGPGNDTLDGGPGNNTVIQD